MSLRGWDYFVMSLAHELKMTRRQLLCTIDSHELTLWSAYFREMNTPQQKKQKPKEVEGTLMNLFQAKASKKPKRIRKRNASVAS
jgi:hypothetical protein